MCSWISMRWIHHFIDRSLCCTYFIPHASIASMIIHGAYVLTTLHYKVGWIFAKLYAITSNRFYYGLEGLAFWIPSWTWIIYQTTTTNIFHELRDVYVCVFVERDASSSAFHPGRYHCISLAQLTVWPYHLWTIVGRYFNGVACILLL